MSSAISSIYDEISDWQVAYGPPNLITNPSFETNTTGWVTSGSNTIERNTEQAKVGSYSLKCTYQDHPTIAGLSSITLTAVAHTWGAWVYIPSDNNATTLRTRWANFTGISGVTNGAADITKKDQWQFVPAFATPDAGDLAGALIVDYVGGSEPTPGKFIYIDAARCEAWPSSTLVPCWEIDNIRDVLEPASAPVRILSIADNATGAESAVFVALGKTIQASWRIKDTLYYKPIAHIGSLRNALPELTRYCTSYIDAVREGRGPTSQSYVESFSMTPGVYRYPEGSGDPYYGVEVMLTVNEVI